LAKTGITASGQRAGRKQRRGHCRQHDNTGGIILREIKFRAWDGTENRFYPWTDDLFVSCSGKIFEVDYDDIEEGTPIECFSCFEIEQFTGLHDKNGKEIYEGDIVRGPGFGAVSVYFDGGRFCLYFLGDEYWNEYADKIEIVGNIHENPELLEVTK
jgi:hypothetical protein